MARAVADQLTTDGVVHRSKLGVTIQPMTPELAQGLGVPNARGALVSDIEPGSPAEHAGIKPGDVIVSLNGQRVTDPNALRNQFDRDEVGPSRRARARAAGGTSPGAG